MKFAKFKGSNNSFSLSMAVHPRSSKNWLILLTGCLDGGDVCICYPFGFFVCFLPRCRPFFYRGTRSSCNPTCSSSASRLLADSTTCKPPNTPSASMFAMLAKKGGKDCTNTLRFGIKNKHTNVMFYVINNARNS